MNLAFQRMQLTRFKSFEKLDLDIGGYEAGLHFIRGRNQLDPGLGSNGVGKSTVWDALCWCLFGTTPKGLRNPDVKPWVGSGAATAVEVVLKAGGVTHRVRRQSTPNRLTVNGNDREQEHVDKLLGLGADTFFHTVVLGQGQPLFYDLAPRAKMDLFSTVLDLDRWDTYGQRATDKVGRLQRLETEVNTTLEVQGARAKQCDKELLDLQERAREFELARNDRLDKLDGEVSANAGQLAKLQKERDKADLAYDGACAELKQIERDVDKLFKAINEAAAAEEKHDLKLSAWRERRDAIDVELMAMPDNCPTCGQPMNDAKRKAYKDKLLDEDDALVDKLRKAKPTTDKLAAVSGDLKRQEQGIGKQARDWSKIRDDAKAVVDYATPLCIELEQKVKNADKLLDEIKGQPNPYHDQIQERRREKKRLAAEDAELRDKLERLLGQIERTKFWTKGFKDVRLYVIDALMQELEMATNAMLPEVGLDGWQVRYDVERTTKAGTTQRGLNVAILSPDNEQPVKWESWSGGEGQRLRIVGALALADVLLAHAGVQADIEVLDEPTQHLSGEGVRDLCDFLQARAQGLDKAVFYVDHQSVESARFQSVTTIVKDKLGSHLAAA